MRKVTDPTGGYHWTTMYIAVVVTVLLVLRLVGVN